MPYHHFTLDERFKIEVWLEERLSQSEIARRLDKSQSCVNREISRNFDLSLGYYSARRAQKLARERNRKGRRTCKKLFKNKRLFRSILNNLKKKDSPEQIVGRRKYLKKEYVVHETIYRYIYDEAPDLNRYLRQKKGKYRRRHGTKERETKREEGKKRRIDTRPAIVGTRKEIGHWEGDTIKGKDHSGSIATHVERISGYGLAHKLERGTAQNLREGMTKKFSRMPKDKKKTETFDNGTEFSEYERIEKETGMVIYFAYPYHSWERGSNENFNGLLRQFFPKGADFATITQKDVDKALRNLNHRPRKRLGYLTPHEVFKKDFKLCTSS